MDTYPEDEVNSKKTRKTQYGKDQHREGHKRQNKGRWAPDEWADTRPDLVLTVASPLLQSPIMIISETNSPSREYTVTQLSLPVKLPKTTQYAHETPSSHPSTLEKHVSQLSLPVI
jgi:hypothetical protein